MNEAISERIKLRRKQLGLTQEDLAEMAESTQHRIWLYESGKGMPSLDKLILLAEALGTSADWLLGLSDDIMPISSAKDLSDAELRLLNIYRSKSPEAQQRLLDVAKVV